MKPQYIRYGLGLDYVPKWGIQQALREIYQNYIDFGKFNDEIFFLPDDFIQIKITNNWNPEDFRFLIIGNSNKGENQIGKYGEGLKLALLVCLRLGYNINLRFGNYIAVPFISKNEMLGCDTLAVKILYSSEKQEGFVTLINVPKVEFDIFRDKILDRSKIIFSCEYGDVVKYEPGNVFCGGIWVCKVEGFSKAYNYPPKYLQLDRDREIPQSFHLEYYAGIIQNLQKSLKVQDLGLNDNRYIDHIPDDVKEQVRPITTDGNRIEFVEKETGKVIAERARDILIKDEKFTEEIKELKASANISDTEAIQNFKDKYIRKGSEMEMDFDLLIIKLNKIQLCS